MPRLSRTRRVIIAALAVAQMAVPALVAIADAELAARAGGAEQVHIEDHARRNCRPAHADDCALCQLLSHFAPQRAGATIVPTSMAERAVACGGPSRLESRFTRALERSRAPPVG